MAIAELVMPKLGESIMEATILKWYKKVGDTVKQDETVLDIATDKVDSEVPSTAEGVITEILFNVNDVVPIGTVIAKIETNVAAATNPVIATPAPVVEQPAAVAIPPAAPEVPVIPYVPQPVSSPVKAGNNRFYSPLVLNIANSEGLSMAELEFIPGTGNDGRVSKKDILQYIADKRAGKIAAPIQQQVYQSAAIPAPVAAPTETVVVTPTAAPVIPPPTAAAAPTPAQPQPIPQAPVTNPTGNVEIIEMDRMRKLIAKHMVDSKHTSPHVTSFVEADVTNMVMWREKVKKDFEKREGTKITYTPLFIECLTKVIKRFPIINSSVDGERIIIKKDINIGMATALPNGNLIVPVIRNADYLNLVGLSKAVNAMADNARNNRLKPDDTQGGTFTLTNVGTFGSLMGTPIISQPQVAILAVGAIKKRPVVIETPEGDTIGVRHMMYLSMSYDHRIIDGSIGASFLTEVAKEFERWDINREG